MCFVCIGEQTAIISLYSINWLVFITETVCVYWAVRSDPLSIIQVDFHLSPVVAICTTSLTFNNSTFCPHSVFMCFVWISEQTAIFPYTALTDWFLSAFAKLRKATINFVKSVRPRGTTRLPLDGFSWNLIFEDFSRKKKNLLRKIQVSLKPDNSDRYCTWRPLYILYHILLSSFQNKKYFSQSCRETRIIHFTFNNPPSQIMPVMR